MMERIGTLGGGLLLVSLVTAEGCSSSPTSHGGTVPLAIGGSAPLGIVDASATGDTSTALGGSSNTATTESGRAAAGGVLATGGISPTTAGLATGGALVTSIVATTTGATAAGGVPSVGGAPATGGALATGGMPAAGGALEAGGALATGGAQVTGGIPATGGGLEAGGIPATADGAATGGNLAVGGVPTAQDTTSIAAGSGVRPCSGRCRVRMLFATQDIAFDIQVPPLGSVSASVTACPDGPDLGNRVCVGFGDIGDTPWTPSRVGNQDALMGNVGVRIPHWAVAVSAPPAGSATCDIAVNTNLPVQITLPEGTPAADFVPGCSFATGVDVEILQEHIPFTLNGSSSLCVSAVVAAQDNGGLFALKQSVEALMANVVQQQICQS